MAGYLASAGLPIGFGEWMKYGLPLVPVLGLVVGVYMYIRCIPKLLVKTINPSEIVRAAFYGVDGEEQARLSSRPRALTMYGVSGAPTEKLSRLMLLRQPSDTKRSAETITSVTRRLIPGARL